MIEETTLPEVPALIVPPGYDPQPRRWRASCSLGYCEVALAERLALLPAKIVGEGESPEAAIDALLRPMCARGVLDVGDVLPVGVLEVGDDDVPLYWVVRIELDAEGAWKWRSV